MNMLEIAQNAKGNQFYPTPSALAERMIAKVDWTYVSSILEPSAGKGDLLRSVTKHEQRHCPFDVDCVEVDPYLREILKYNYSEELRQTHKRYSDEWEAFFDNGIKVVHDDFLTYQPLKRYDLILMNPPFSVGDRHLLKALQLQESGGQVVCLLNAETLRNPYSAMRQELLRLLNKYAADIEYLADAFRDAERTTDVDVAIVSVNIPHAKPESDIFERFKQAERIEDDFQVAATTLALHDYIKAAVAQYRVESQSGIELIKQYHALAPYMMDSFDSKYAKPILNLVDSNGSNYSGITVNKYLERVRYKYWKALLGNRQFMSRLTSTLQEEFRDYLDRLAGYDFTEFNIRQLAIEMNARVQKGIEDEIGIMFDRLTSEHTYYKECVNNRHYYDGWCTNKAHKIGKKVILPAYGVFDSWRPTPRAYDARKILEDIERVLNFFAGDQAGASDWAILEHHFDNGITKNIPLKHFSATFYKKGTVHLVFNCPDLIERFNIHVGKGRNWLPPSYGQKTYSNFTPEEKAVVDSFQGEKAYEAITQNAGYFFAPVTGGQILALHD